MMERLLSLYVAAMNADLRRQEGQTMVEYTLVVALMVVVVAALALSPLRDAVDSLITEISTKLGSVI